MKECTYQSDISAERMSDGIDTVYFCDECFENGAKDDELVLDCSDYDDKTQNVECQICGTTYFDELSLQDKA